MRSTKKRVVRCFEIFRVVDFCEAYAYNCHVFRAKYLLVLRLARENATTARVLMLQPLPGCIFLCSYLTKSTNSALVGV